jgi:hypothetical protein
MDETGATLVIACLHELDVLGLEEQTLQFGDIVPNTNRFGPPE